MSTNTNNVIASVNGGSSIQKFFAAYAQEACRVALAGTEFIVGEPVLNERENSEGWMVNEFVRVPLTVAGSKEGRNLFLVLSVGIVSGPSYPFTGDSFQVYGPTVEGLDNGNIVVEFKKHSGHTAWEVEKGLSTEMLLQHSNTVGGVAEAVWAFIRNQGKKFLSGTLTFGMSKSQIIKSASEAIKATGIRLPWNAATWGPTMGKTSEEVKLDVEATELSHHLWDFLSAFFPKALDPQDVAFLRYILRRCSGPGMQSPLTTVNIWDVAAAFETPWEANNAAQELCFEAELLLEPYGLEPMTSAIGENLVRMTEPDLREVFGEEETLQRRRELSAAAAQRVAEATLEQVKKTASAGISSEE